MGKRELSAVEGVFSTGWLGMGSEVDRFEQSLCGFTGRDHAIAVSNGTGALFLALKSLGLAEGDEVIVPSLTYVASIQAITAAGLKPVFCDVGLNDLNMDIDDVIGKITRRTGAIMPVHYRGVPCDMDRLMELTAEKDIRMVEDAAHAFGSFYKEKRIGSIGDLTCFSFDPIKVITCGEGGAVLTGNPQAAERMQQMRILGIDRDTLSRYKNKRSWMYDVQMQGYRLHMSNINAAIGLVQLDRFDELSGRRRQIADRYDRALKKLKKISILSWDSKNTSLFMYIVRVHEKRDRLIAFMKEKGVGTGLHYIPAHTFSLYRNAGSSLPVTERVYEEIMTLPLFPDMTDEEVSQVISALQEWDITAG